MSRPIITLTTDFGTGSPYVAQMKGAILSINPDANIVDISHNIPPQDIRQGAIALTEIVDVFPAETIHVAVVDPGVGTDRNILCNRMADCFFIAPDNGLLSLVAKRHEPTLQLAVTNEKYWRDNVSATFHGRDIMGPVGAHLSLGVVPEEVGEPIENLVRITLPEVDISANEIKGSVVSFDSFGNLITDITRGMLEDARQSGQFQIRCGTQIVNELVQTYGTGLPLDLVALIGSSGLLELSVINGNAAQRLGVELGERVIVTW